ncbi:hypothetical protein [Paenibacillus marchantiophytorum]|uniref:hypothetical protein n=1 Tax=Paenibacillus marchantiophytorum TaxID=1619310 RepID=UPI00166A3E65|nr:hypothetical protein [Paenibacillus marchantiophytorum]
MRKEMAKGLLCMSLVGSVLFVLTGNSIVSAKEPVKIQPVAPKEEMRFQLVTPKKEVRFQSVALRKKCGFSRLPLRKINILLYQSKIK